MEHAGPATLIFHSAAWGRMERPVQWVRGSPPQRRAQYAVAVLLSWRSSRGDRSATWIVPDNGRYAEVVAGGKVVWDSRSVVPCDMAAWERLRQQCRPESAATASQA